MLDAIVHGHENTDGYAVTVPRPDSPQVVEDLIYDVGMHRGEDTAYYLAKGYRVIAFEANPELVQECRAKFADALDAGTLTIVEGAIADSSDDSVQFYVDPVSVWGSVDPDWVRKKNVESVQRPISVPVVDLAACMRDHGVPHYLKIDIEGADRLCLEALRDIRERPRLVSMEAEQFDFAALMADLDLLEELGYREFAAVQQARQTHGEIATRTLSGEPLSFHFEPGSSGPFGNDLGDAWRSRDAVERRYRRAFRRYRLRRRLTASAIALRMLGPAFRRSHRLRQLLGGYYDTHARREPSEVGTHAGESSGS